MEGAQGRAQPPLKVVITSSDTGWQTPASQLPLAFSREQKAEVSTRSSASPPAYRGFFSFPKCICCHCAMSEEHAGEYRGLLWCLCSRRCSASLGIAVLHRRKVRWSLPLLHQPAHCKGTAPFSFQQCIGKVLCNSVALPHRCSLLLPHSHGAVLLSEVSAAHIPVSQRQESCRGNPQYLSHRECWSWKCHSKVDASGLGGKNWDGCSVTGLWSTGPGLNGKGRIIGKHRVGCCPPAHLHTQSLIGHRNLHLSRSSPKPGIIHCLAVLRRIIMGYVGPDAHGKTPERVGMILAQP